MYSFGPLPKYKQSGRVIGTHQKIDRVARRHLSPLLRNEDEFPDIRAIVHFEGIRGPDGAKIKSAGRDEPWHFIDPHDPTHDRRLLDAIGDHKINLTHALKHANKERAAFEASWLAHAVTDGLTPAHHFTDIEAIRQDDSRPASFKTKFIMAGSGKDFIRNNWRYWGASGVMTSHTLFEAGVATAAKPMRFTQAAIHEDDIHHLKQVGFEQLYIELVEEIAHLHMYDRFKRTGWTRTLARQTAHELMPTIIRAVTLAWYDCVMESRQ